MTAPRSSDVALTQQPRSTARSVPSYVFDVTTLIGTRVAVEEQVHDVAVAFHSDDDFQWPTSGYA